MNAMTRRGFLGTSTALAVSGLLPIPKAMSLVAPDAPPLRWFAVGDGEMAYSFLSESYEHARRMYAWEHGATIDEECPECGETSCLAHNADLDAPLDWVEVSHEFSSEFTAGNEPKLIDWVRAGFNVPCEGCDYGEPTECYVFEDRALCGECLDNARRNSVDATKERD